MERDRGVFLLQCAAPAGGQGAGGSGDERLTVELPGAAAQPSPDVARMEDVLAPKHVDPELAAAMRADAAGDPDGATTLGVLLEQRGDLEGALAAYRRGDRRGDPNGSFNLGCLLAERGEVSDARAAFERADARGDAAAASNLGVLLEQEGDLDGALAAYGRGDERGDAAAAFNLGLLLAGRGDLQGARAAYRRAAERDDPEVRERALEAEAEIAGAEVEIAGAEVETAGANAETAAPEPVAEPEPRSRRRWIVALCVVAVLALLVLRRRR